MIDGEYANDWYRREFFKALFLSAYKIGLCICIKKVSSRSGLQRKGKQEIGRRTSKVNFSQESRLKNRNRSEDQVPGDREVAYSWDEWRTGMISDYLKTLALNRYIKQI